MNVLVTLGYGGLGIAVAHYFARFGLFPAPIWLPASVALTAAVLRGAAATPGIFLGSFLANYFLFDPPAWVAALISLGNAAGPVIGATLMRRVVEPHQEFKSLHGLGAFIGFGVLLHAALVALGGTLTLAIHEGHTLQAALGIWLTWFLSDAGGMLYLAPTMLLWLGPEPRFRSGHSLMEGLCVSGATLLVALLLFTGVLLQASRDDLLNAAAYLLALPITWVTVRWSLRSAATLFTLIAIIATAGTMAGSGPFNAPWITSPLVALGSMVVLCGINMLLVAALVEERRSAVARLADVNRSLEARVAARTIDLDAARLAAEDASRAKSRFLAAMTHELRTPLNAIIGFAGAIRLGIYGSSAEPRYREAVGLIESSGRHLLSLVDSLLDAAKMEAGTFELADEPIDLAAIADETLAVMGPLAAERQLRLERISDGPLPTTRGDARAMRQVLLNLLSNAVKFTEPGGRVTLETRRADDAVVIEIRDTGIGMSAAEAALALQPFGRVDNPLTRADRTGTGLGLPLAKAMTEAQGGAFMLHSRHGEGTRVLLTFPAMAATAPGTAAEPDAAAPPMRERRAAP